MQAENDGNGKGFNPYAMVMGLSGHHSHVSEPYYLKVLDNPTDNFENTNYVFRELETAKNNWVYLSFEKYTKKAEELMKKFPDFL